MIKDKKILVVRKMSSLEFYYKGNHKSAELKESHEEHNGNTKKILEKLEKAGFQYRVVTRNELTEALVDDYDFVFSLGGDGTAIAAAAFNKDKPQLNLKTDVKSKGELCCHDIEQALEDFFNEKYKIEEWTRQDVYHDKKFIGRALNETIFGEDLRVSKMARYNIKIDGKEVFNGSSGVVIVTGTGSTGWPRTFRHYSKKSQIFKCITILPGEGRRRGEGNYFEIEYKGHEGKFVFDITEDKGSSALDTIEYDLPRDSILEIKLSENPLKIIKPKTKNKVYNG